MYLFGVDEQILFVIHFKAANSALNLLPPGPHRFGMLSHKVSAE